MKKSALISLLMLIIYLITLPSCQTNQPFSLGMNTDGDLEISYLSGQLTFVDELPNQKIYTDEYPDDVYVTGVALKPTQPSIIPPLPEAIVKPSICIPPE